MSQFVILAARGRNFGPFREAEIRFDRAGLTLIEGVMLNRPGASSNGAGKSMVFELVSWVAYDKCLRSKYAGDKLISRGMKAEGMYGQLEIATATGAVLEITRYRKDPVKGDRVELKLDGKDITRGTNPETDNAIIAALGGFDFTAFTNSIAFAARDDVRSFLAATDSERKAVLDRILGLDIFAVAEAIAKTRHKAAALALATAQERRTGAEATLSDRTATLATTEAEGADVAGLERAVRVQRLKVRAAAKAMAVPAGNIQRLEKEAAPLRVFIAAAQKTYATRKAEYDAWKAADTKRRTVAQANINSATASLNAVKARRDAFIKLASDTCPTCKQRIGADHCASVVASFEAEMRDHAYTADINRMDLDMADKEGAQTEPTPPNRVILDSIETDIADEVHAQEIATAKHEAAVELLEQMTQQWQQAASVVERARLDVETAQAALAAARATLADAELAEARAAFWAAGFGNTGIKSFLIESELSEINRRCGAYAQRLLGPGAAVWLTAVRELKSGKGSKEEITVHADIPGCCAEYHGGSKGQKRRMDLCVLLALRDIVASRSANACSQLFVDEVFDGVDGAGRDSIVELLREMTTTGPIFLVTHDDGLRKAADQIITVTHHGEYATLSQD